MSLGAGHLWLDVVHTERFVMLECQRCGAMREGRAMRLTRMLRSIARWAGVKPATAVGERRPLGTCRGRS